METVLIIEDDSTMLRGLKDNFEYAGYHVLTADDGEKGQVSFDSTQIPVAGPPREVINEKMEIADRYK